ncbi:diketogulonate reductase-like aldo/keto reductase [Orbus hercynius]|uniref:Diketogulonate reductase-like aldo/keto reductase n=1 Tax=Orbus hercynius TaxID=593135 RepID=A0A495RAI7_9GAMM|nr:aldo/keto reductase [Orbus hercynius]RKS84507.1 diketogulonate reductase-like aldo/keto reductase [Orbus hercynius]
MSLSLSSMITLNEDVSLPILGFGTYKIIDLAEMNQAVNQALHVGYRAFDTAQLYKNEQQLGVALQNSGYQRQDYFVTSKVHNLNQGYDETLKAFDQVLADLQMDYVDLFLVHWPLSNTFFETWQALEIIYTQKRAKAIGVCNFNISHLELLATQAKIKPMINQIELHPYFTQEKLVQYLRQEQIAIEAWSPLAQGKVNEDTLLISLGEKYHKSASQITLRWHMQKGYIAIPKSSNASRIADNANIFDFVLSDEEVVAIDKLNQDRRLGPNPNDVYKKNGF